MQAFYLRNIHPEMSVTWNSYPDQLGHPARRKGCFRCHNENIVDEAGKPIEDECTLCHSIIANDSADPFRFQMTVREKGRSRRYDAQALEGGVPGSTLR